jgi:hypothetical protein
MRVDDPKAIVDVLLGALAIADGSRTLATFMDDLKSRDTTESRIGHVRTALASLSSVRSTASVEGDVPPPPDAGRGRSKRL